MFNYKKTIFIYNIDLYAKIFFAYKILILKLKIKIKTKNVFKTCQYHDSEEFFKYIPYQRSNMYVYIQKLRFISKIHVYKNPKLYIKTNMFMSIPTVYPGPLS